jgi:hypothetical protein
MSSAKEFEKLTKGFSKILSRKIIISLFDYSGIWPLYYAKAGFKVLQVDLKLGVDIFDFQFRKISRDLVFGILAAPPCTDFTVSGAQYWVEKDRDGRTLKSLSLINKTLEIIQYFDPEFWALENPVGRLSKLVPELGKPWYFQPYNFGNRWAKKTGVWGKFNKPKARYVKPIRFSQQGSWTQLLGGKSGRTKELRSITPLGFAKAFFDVNHLSIKIKRNKMELLQFEHKEFLKVNGKDKNAFSEPLQMKMAIFDNMHSKLQETVGEDQNRLAKLIEEFDREILEDMEEEYSDQLENNEMEASDEDILENLYKKGKRKVYMSELKNLGFENDLSSNRIVVVGQYYLERISAFQFQFCIHKTSNTS